MPDDRSMTSPTTFGASCQAIIREREALLRVVNEFHACPKLIKALDEYNVRPNLCSVHVADHRTWLH